MTLPMIGRWSDSKVFDESADRLAKLAMGACDGTKHGNPLYDSSAFIGYPTRRNTEALFRTALALPDNGKVDGRGIPLGQLFAAAWERVDADAGEDDAAKSLLQDFFDAIEAGEEWTGAPEQIERALKVLASFDDDALWVLYVKAAWPNHPGTPGSPRWNEVEAQGGPHESSANPFVGRGGY